MKNLIICIFLMLSISLISQNQARIDVQEKYDALCIEVEKATDAKFAFGSWFHFNEPYEAVFNTETKMYSYQGTESTEKIFQAGDTVLVIAAKPVMSSKIIKLKNEDTTYETAAFGKSGFDIIEKTKYKEQLKKIKATDWKTVQTKALLLDCGRAAQNGYANTEQYHIFFGDTQVFYRIRGENERIKLEFRLKTFQGNEFKDMGHAVPNTSFAELTFMNDEKVKFNHIGEEDNYDGIVLDITDHQELFREGIKNINISLSKKAANYDITEEDSHTISIKLDCIKF